MDLNIDVDGSADQGTDADLKCRVFVNYPTVSAGYIVSEHPTFLESNSVLCVVNNQKCVLYDSTDGRKICDTYSNDDMIIGIKSFIFNDTDEVMFCASSDGMIVLYLVGISSKNYRIVMLLKVKIQCASLLSIHINKRNGDLICVYFLDDDELNTEISILSFDYNKIVKLRPKYNDKIFIIVPTHSSGIRPPDLPEYVKCFKRICSVLSKVNVLSVNNTLGTIGMGIGKLAVILSLVNEKMICFELISNICTIAFDTKSSIALGDSNGRIFIYDLDFDDNVSNQNFLVMCDMPSEYFGIDVSYFKQKIGSFSTYKGSMNSGSNAEDDGTFRNFRKVSVVSKTFHWHAHGVNCMSFNKDGNILLSGGEEGVLVIWNIPNNTKNFVTRLGSAIFYLGLSSSEDIYFVACEKNEIFFIDPHALCITSRITGLSIPITVGIRTTKEYNNLSMSDIIGIMDPNDFILNKSINVCYSVPIFRYWPNTSLTAISMENKALANDIIGGNVAISSHSSKLQIYNYINDCEVDYLDLKNVNAVSRQDEEFGEDWNLDELCVSNDGSIVVTIQSRTMLYSSDNMTYNRIQSLSQFEHEAHSNNKKSTLKFWVRTYDSSKDKNVFSIHTKIFNPHNHRATSILQIPNTYAFFTASMDSEFKIWNIVKKTIVPNDLGFSTYAKNTQELSQSININSINFEDYVWVCVSYGSYKNFPCVTSCISVDGSLLGISHDTVISLWEIEKFQNCRFIKSISLQNVDARDLEDDLPYRNVSAYIKFIYPHENIFMLFSNNTRLYIWDFSKNSAIWNYPLEKGLEIGNVLYDAILPNILVVTTISVKDGKCQDRLEVFTLEITYESGMGNAILVDKIFDQKRDVSRTILNMCLAPSPVNLNCVNNKDMAIFPTNTMSITLILLTANFQIETLIFTFDTYKASKLTVIAAVDTQEIRHEDILEKTSCVKGDDLLEQLLRAQHTVHVSGKKKRSKFNLAEQMCKSVEWRYRVKNPIPKELLKNVVDLGCPTYSLPPPNVVYNRLMEILNTKYTKET